MTLHPWPLNDERSAGEHASVLWTCPRGLGLMADSLAVPLRFSLEEAVGPEVALGAPRPTPAATILHKACAGFNASALFQLRDISSRFGTSA